ncbi:sensor histidine kinase CitA [bacterium BMS3Abin12]|nr:sensor histidine kinase CitA [bacterium BMS3Abin12]
MMLEIAVTSYAVGAAAFLVLALVLLVGRRGWLHKPLLTWAAFASAVWMAAAAYDAFDHRLGLLIVVLELVRDLSWSIFLLHVLASAQEGFRRGSRRFRLAVAGLFAFTIGLIVLVYHQQFTKAPLVTFGVDWLIAGYLSYAIIGLVLVEQLFRNTPQSLRRSVKYLCLGVGALFAYDFYLYSNALLFQRIDFVLWEARGFANALMVPIIGIAVARDTRWSVDISVSRRMVFHTAALLGTGLYLLAMAAGGYYVRHFGGSWGVVAQTLFFFGAGIVLLILLFSEQLRANLRVLINKNFFHYKYDYRDEWLRFIRTLASGEPTQIRERVVLAMARIVDSPGGVLWMRREGGGYEPVAHWGMAQPTLPAVSVQDPLVRFLEEQEWFIDIDEYEGDPDRYKGLRLPDWLHRPSTAALIVPLMFHDRLLGFTVLARPPTRRRYNWEDYDLLKTVGRQAASHLAQLETTQALAVARQFEAFNRCSAYVVHDLKNLIAQLSLVLSNATRHRGNPEFMEDVLHTVENSVAMMQRLLDQLRSGAMGQPDSNGIDLEQILLEVARGKAARRPVPIVEIHRHGLIVRADHDRLVAVIGHIVQNAQDATPKGGQVILSLLCSQDSAVIEVRDSGSGMDEAFIRDCLFRPFYTTKGESGMGIGAYEVQEYVESVGGKVEVESSKGSGTVFRVRLPALDGLPDSGVHHRQVNG